MTHRERHLESLCFGKPDKFVLAPGGPRESTLAAWYTQGLPRGVPYFTALQEALGLEAEPENHLPDPGASFTMIPQFEEKVLEHRNGHYIVQDWMG
ncbi:MAG: hypothetical protein O2954_19350, partial [bacterium]|nr:hypothetical protein [bacterium]